MAGHLSIAQVKLPTHFAHIPDESCCQCFIDLNRILRSILLKRSSSANGAHLAGGVKFLLLCKEGVSAASEPTSAATGGVSASRFAPGGFSPVLIRNGMLANLERESRPQRVLA